MTNAAKKAFVARMAKARRKKKKNPRAKPTRRKPAASKRKKNPPAAKFSIKKRGTAANQYWQVIGPGNRVFAQYQDEATARKHLRALKSARNPDDMSAAGLMYEEFHGRKHARVVEHREELEYRSELAELGKLLELRFRLAGERSPVPLLNFGPCQVACDPAGTNLYFLGGNQTVNLDDLGIETDKDLVELGELTYIKYFSRKGFHDFQPVDYYHQVGEENGIRPVLCYDQINEKLYLTGGNYQVKPAGITN